MSIVHVTDPGNNGHLIADETTPGNHTFIDLGAPASNQTRFLDLPQSVGLKMTLYRSGGGANKTNVKGQWNGNILHSAGTGFPESFDLFGNSVIVLESVPSLGMYYGCGWMAVAHCQITFNEEQP